MTQEKRNDAEIQEAVKAQFVGVAPEREAELKELWESYNLEFSLLEDQGHVEMAGGAYRYVRFNHRMLRMLWVSAFAAWEAYRCADEGVRTGTVIELTRLNELLELALAIRDADDPESVPLQGLPEPGNFPDRESVPELRAAAELAVFVSGWAMLHEVRHLKHQQEGTSSQPDTPSAEQHTEELSCDQFATEYLLAKVDEFATSSGQNGDSIRKKRALGIYFAMFALSVLAHDSWQASDSHPSIQARLDATRALVSGADVDEALGMAILAFFSLREIWPGAPGYEVKSDGTE